MSDGNDEEEEKVGYGRPPKKHQFQKGTSGNPKGSSKMAKYSSAIDSALSRTFEIILEGKKYRLPIVEIAVIKLAERAIKEGGAALKDLLRLADQSPVYRAITKNFDRDRYLYERHGAMEKLGICSTGDDGKSYIKAWVLIEAIKRMRDVYVDLETKTHIDNYAESPIYIFEYIQNKLKKKVEGIG